VTTEDGSAGHKGLVTELLEQFLSTSHFASRTKSPRSPLYKRGVGGIYACGPHPMLAAIAPVAEKYDLPYQASLEANMACGFGVCMGCVVPVEGDQRERAYRLVCKDGPVFDGRDIIWSNEFVPSIRSIRSTDQTDRT
jgi:dihydroorotate dehydrogenase electron transfer subunit